MTHYLVEFDVDNAPAWDLCWAESSLLACRIWLQRARDGAFVGDKEMLIVYEMPLAHMSEDPYVPFDSLPRETYQAFRSVGGWELQWYIAVFNRED